MEIKLRFWGQFGEIYCQTGEDAYEMIYGDKFCFNDCEPINHLLSNPLVKTMLFSGLKDKNGKEIYEGDIVKCLLATEPEDKGFICQFKDYRWKFNNVRYPNDDFYGSVNYNYIQQNCEVIGNIYENPELLP